MASRSAALAFLYFFFALVSLAALGLLLAGVVKSPGKGSGESSGGGSSGGGATGNQLPPCSLTVDFSSLPSSEGCCPGGELRLVLLGESQTPFLAGAVPVSYISVCSTLCQKIERGPGGKILCFSSEVGGEERFQECLREIDPTGKCQGLALPVATAGTAFLYARRAASSQEAGICGGACPLGW